MTGDRPDGVEARAAPASDGAGADTAPGVAVEVSDLHVTLGNTQVLKGIDLTIPRGRIVALIGPNGSGKTTLLRCILGLHRPDRGAIRLFGEPQSGRQLRRVGYVPQKVSIERSFILSVREFLALRLRETRNWFWHRRSATDALLEAAVDEIGLERLLDRPLAQLSGGQLQRVLIAFSLLHDPDLLLLDEPTSGVDAPGEHTFYELISEIHAKHGMTVILVSHDLSMVYRHASWVYAVNRVICCEGPPAQVMNADALKHAYGIHVSPYHHEHHGHSH